MPNQHSALSHRWSVPARVGGSACLASALVLAAYMLTSVAVAQDQTIEIEDDHGATGLSPQEQADLDTIDADLKDMHGQLVGACDINLDEPLAKADFDQCAEFPLKLKGVKFSDLDKDGDGIADSIERESHLRERLAAEQ